MRLLLDTSAFILAVETPERLSRDARAALSPSENILELSAVSLSEIAIKASAGKLRMTAETTRQALDDFDVRVLAYSAEHAFAMFDLPVHHRDPFDRQIIAQALVENIPIVTSDRIFRLYKGLKIIW
ncbi:MAG TPA: type II toxin-antitoxin system VapC family toxin [Candidatus Angelobacter sp.]|nr:type II toxin-antitoxin system VapC family toxin [Candidatus Angelobacter sp.]